MANDFHNLELSPQKRGAPLPFSFPLGTSTPISFSILEGMETEPFRSKRYYFPNDFDCLLHCVQRVHKFRKGPFPFTQNSQTTIFRSIFRSDGTLSPVRNRNSLAHRRCIPWKQTMFFLFHPLLVDPIFSFLPIWQKNRFAISRQSCLRWAFDRT